MKHGENKSRYPDSSDPKPRSRIASPPPCPAIGCTRANITGFEHDLLSFSCTQIWRIMSTQPLLSHPNTYHLRTVSAGDFKETQKTIGHIMVTPH